MLRILLATITVLACCTQNKTRTMDRTTTSPECSTSSEVERSFNKVCTVVGVYELNEFYTKKKTLMANWPVVVLDDGKVVLIESLWDKTKRHDDATIANYQGKRVRVTGKLHGQPPGSIQNISVPCVSPVDDIRLE